MERLAAEGPFIGRSIFVYFSFALTGRREKGVGNSAGGKEEKGPSCF